MKTSNSPEVIFSRLVADHKRLRCFFLDGAYHALSLTTGGWQIDLNPPWLMLVGTTPKPYGLTLNLGIERGDLAASSWSGSAYLAPLGQVLPDGTYVEE